MGYPEFGFNGSHLIAEEVLAGIQVTLEGFVVGGTAVTIGVVDSTMYEGTTSFEWFTFPSRLDPTVIDRMSLISQRVLTSLEYTHGLFNIEFMYEPASGTIHVVEVNPRMCGQFADLFQSVTGINTYEILFRSGLGLLHRSDLQHIETKGVSGSHAVRTFSDGLVTSVPSQRRVRTLMCIGHITLFIVYCQVGDLLSARPKQFDGESYRYAVINGRAPSFRVLERRVKRCIRWSGLRVAG